MNLFDLHCDTLFRCCTTGGDIYRNDYCLSVEKAAYIDKWIQCMAIWMPDNLRGDAAWDFFYSAYELLNKQSNIPKRLEYREKLADSDKRKFLFTVEGGSAIAGKIENIRRMAELGVKILTLTWNAENEIGGGADTDKGLSGFGKRALAELEENDITVDVSHASDRLFYDIAQYSTKPFIATHSNSRTICGHKRNLTDEQFKIIRDNGGIVGLNFCRIFLQREGNAKIDDLYRHTDYFLSLGGENTVAIGTDFDGTDLPDGIDGIQDIYKLYDYLLQRNYSEELVNKIFFDNAYRFFTDKKPV